MWERVKEGFDVFLTEGGQSFGAVRQLRKTELVIYVENAGDFDVPFAEVKDAGAGKVVLDEKAAFTEAAPSHRRCAPARGPAHLKSYTWGDNEKTDFGGLAACLCCAFVDALRRA